jgi:UDP-glucose 4-epimerase
VKQRTGSKSPIVSVPYDQAYEPGFEDMPRRVPALEKLEELTGFRPGIPLNDIVDGVIAYFQDKANAAVGTVAGSRASYPMAAKASAD